MSEPMTTKKIRGVWYAWHECFPRGVRAAKRKRDAVEAVHRSHAKGAAAERLEFRIVDRLIDRRKKNRHPILVAIAASHGIPWM